MLFGTTVFSAWPYGLDATACPLFQVDRFPSPSPPPQLLRKANRRNCSSPFLITAHCFTVDSSRITFLGRLFYFTCLLLMQEPPSGTVFFFLCLCWYLHANQAHAYLFRSQIILLFCLFVILCLPHHHFFFFSFHGLLSSISSLEWHGLVIAMQFRLAK